MQRPHANVGVRHHEFVLIGDPVAHSLSPAMHNAVYRTMGAKDGYFAKWRYSAQRCATEEEALEQIGLVRTGVYRGMNITMPYKRLAMKAADYVDSAADAAGGANVLVRKEFDLYAYNTDGLGAVGAVARASGIDPRGKRIGVCGTGPTSMAIAAAFSNAGASEVVVFSRDHEKARRAIERLQLSTADGSSAHWMRSADYGDAEGLVPSMDVLVDATPRGMKPGDAPIVDTALLREGQVVLDVVYGHGTTALVEGARKAGAFAMDGLEMLVEQAALSIEIWADAMGLHADVPRDIMRDAALGKSSTTGQGE